MVSINRLRVGYVSSEFGNHPLSQLMEYVFGMQNMKHVELFCYALSVNDGVEWRQNIQSKVEHFVDVIKIFAMKPAPIQVSYMGFTRTIEAAYIDYLVIDELVSPLCWSNVKRRISHNKHVAHPRGKVKVFPKDDPSKASKLTAFLGYMVGIAHIVIEVDKTQSNLRLKETCEPVTIIETRPTIIVGVMCYVKTPRGLRVRK
ncbi:hypothetical protein Fmac_024794 [Flemingia macrophylla]|uniref:O-GlcNAc transferase C-terminal domain-containing protein n=1 Tax=Flemingia macrophylla TaxID=520843 RepID=A0ABD1LQF4_9FABA